MADLKSREIRNAYDDLLTKGAGNTVEDGDGVLFDIFNRAFTAGGLVRLPSGLNFNASGGDTLSSFEVGTWSPLYEPTTGSFASITMAVNSADYIKIGRLVVCFWYVITSALDTTGASGLLRIGGLPYTVGGNFGGTGYASEVFNFTSGNVPRSMVASPSTTRMIAIKDGSGTSLNVTDMSTSANRNATIGFFIYLTT